MYRTFIYTTLAAGASAVNLNSKVVVNLASDYNQKEAINHTLLNNAQ